MKRLQNIFMNPFPHSLLSAGQRLAFTYTNPCNYQKESVADIGYLDSFLGFEGYSKHVLGLGVRVFQLGVWLAV